MKDSYGTDTGGRKQGYFSKTERRGSSGSLRMPNVRGKTLRHPSLAPAIAVDGSVLWPSNQVAANVNRSRRQVSRSRHRPAE
jgi:hypothetical protein